MTSSYPSSRLRRVRSSEWSRNLVRENRVTVNDLIWPLFINDGHSDIEAIPSMPGVFRYSVDKVIEQVKLAKSLGISCVALFPNTPADRRSDDGKEALNSDNLMNRAIKAIKDAVPDIGIAADVALDPYTSHGQDGLVKDGLILNDETIEILVQQALVQAKSGADIIAPSDMMDGRVDAIRYGLDLDGFENTQIMSYAVKYASAFYGPFRDAVGSSGTLKGDKKTYQLDPANAQEGLREAEQDISEGADSIIIKPGMPYLDMITRVKETFQMPTYAYQVSGEYSMVMAAVENGWLDKDAVMMESLLSFKRAGADGIWTYFALDVAKHLNG
ncbi:porphobilinogen synthase [Temperatibacter marinus]|uniref:Delta-aminolevulinic acid dehydratase n=1 Tax=Temperatibacter marinus TaxID=1456591 RepID=A0AA52EBD0_9PROT|nr:porphobilinogen synthase [Temperatibacter marinus]WND02222.1 porphobilinogen synthase [Temperatibacter marinus]